MRRFLAIVAVACVAVLASAHGQQHPRYENLPTADDLYKYYPEKALAAGQEGQVWLCCSPRSDRTLVCGVGAQKPLGWNFGSAAIEVSKKLKVTRREYQRLLRVEEPQPYSFQFVLPHPWWKFWEPPKPMRKMFKPPLGMCGGIIS